MNISRTLYCSILRENEVYLYFFVLDPVPPPTRPFYAVELALRPILCACALVDC